MFKKKILRKIDYVLTSIILALMLVGILALMSTTHAFTTGDTSVVTKQSLWILFCLILMVIVANIDYEVLASHSFKLYCFINILLIAVLFTKEINGARSWFNFGPISVQPSELAKIILIITLAKHLDKILSKNELGIHKPKNIIMVSLHFGIPFALILKQPDFGTAMVLLAIVVGMIFMANIDFKIIGIFTAIGVVSLTTLKYLIMKGYTLFFSSYQIERIKVFFDPTYDPRGSGYNVLQAKLAIGSGQLSGMGLFKGMQTQLGNIPENTTDFIFSAVGEELGFIVCTIVVLLFIFLLLRCLYIARNAKDMYGSLVVIGVVALIATHTVVNIGMNLGVVPVTGIPLPFISYGGSSLMTNMIALGLVMSVYSRST